MRNCLGDGTASERGVGVDAKHVVEPLPDVLDVDWDRTRLLEGAPPVLDVVKALFHQGLAQDSVLTFFVDKVVVLEPADAGRLDLAVADGELSSELRPLDLPSQQNPEAGDLHHTATHVSPRAVFGDPPQSDASKS